MDADYFFYMASYWVFAVWTVTLPRFPLSGLKPEEFMRVLALFHGLVPAVPVIAGLFLPRQVEGVRRRRLIPIALTAYVCVIVYPSYLAQRSEVDMIDVVRQFFSFF